MRVDDAGARTWLLAAGAGWGMLAWLLAVFGMGGRITPLADDPGLIKPLLAMPANSVDRLGPLAQYAEIGARPLFSTDRQPKPFSLQGDAEGTAAAAEFDYLLTSVLITPRMQLAILQPPDGSKSVRVKLGEAPDSFPGWRMSALNTRSAVFDGPSGQRTLELRVFDGVGGQPPTAIARDGQPSASIPVSSAIDLPGTPQPVNKVPTIAQDPTQTPQALAQAAAAKAADAPANNAPPMTEQAQMEAIRERIQARRAQLRQQSQSTQPPANSR